jgi:hypothetical protein
MTSGTASAPSPVEASGVPAMASPRANPDLVVPVPVTPPSDNPSSAPPEAPPNGEAP